MDRSTRTGAPGPRERYDVLLDIGRILAGTLQLDQLYHAIYEQASRVLETTGFYISSYDPADDTARVVFYADRGEIGRVDVTYRGSESTAIRERRPVVAQIERPEDAIVLVGSDQKTVTRSSLSAPLMRGDRVLGVLSAQSYKPHAYSADDLELLAAIADLAAVAIDNAHYVAELDMRRREAERIEEIGRAIVASLDVSSVLDRIVSAALELANADTAVVWQLNEDNTRVEVVTSGGPLAFPIGASFPTPRELAASLGRENRAIVLEDVATATLLPPEIRTATRAASAVIVPLFEEGRLLGALAVGHGRRRRYSPEELRLFERLCIQASIGLANAQLHQQIHALSLTDPLTGLANRRQLEIFLAKEFAAAQRGRALTVLLFDLDRFKEYNDTAGHQAGDEALCAFAAILAGQTRAMNLAARYGGDEFVSILADTERRGGLIHAARISEAVTLHPVLGSAISVSVGVASYGSEMENPADLIEAADRDLYRRKAERGEGSPAAAR